MLHQSSSPDLERAWLCTLSLILHQSVWTTDGGEYLGLTFVYVTIIHKPKLERHAQSWDLVKCPTWLTKCPYFRGVLEGLLKLSVLVEVVVLVCPSSLYISYTEHLFYSFHPPIPPPSSVASFGRLWQAVRFKTKMCCVHLQNWLHSCHDRVDNRVMINYHNWVDSYNDRVNSGDTTQFLNQPFWNKRPQ